MDKFSKLTCADIEELTRDFKALGDVSRLKILLYLFSGKKSVNEISVAVGLSQSATSHQLRILKDANILTFEKDGNVNYYEIKDEHVKTVITTAVSHLDC